MGNMTEHLVCVNEEAFVSGYVLIEDEFSSIGLVFNENDAMKLISLDTALSLAKKLRGTVLVKRTIVTTSVVYEEVAYDDIT